MRGLNRCSRRARILTAEFSPVHFSLRFVLAQLGGALLSLFRDLTGYITEQSFASVGELSDSIIAFLAERNRNAKRYVWHAKGERHPAQGRVSTTGVDRHRNGIMLIHLRDTTLGWIPRELNHYA
jgi:hypothetical protein